MRPSIVITVDRDGPGLLIPGLAPLMIPRSWLTSVRRTTSAWLDNFRLQLSRADAVLPLSILGLVAGTLAAVTVIALRLLVDHLQLDLYPMDAAGDFEAMSPASRLAVAMSGGLLVGFLFGLTPKAAHTVGVLHVLERLAYHQGRLPWRNAVVQFFGGAVSMIAGHSVGREGPSAHLGAASSSLPAQALGFPNTSLRVLAASGAAAGIAASFNTPLAGAAFAMEVLMMEYTVAGLAPVILATVSAAALTRGVFGTDVAFTVPPLSPGALSELPYILLSGVLIGLLAAAFNHQFQWVSEQGRKLPDWLGPVLAGLLVGACGAAVPEVMGIGDDTVNRILLGEGELLLLALILVAKMIATIGGIGLGLPGGIIGPTLFIGATAGGLLGAAGLKLGLTDASSLGLYSLIGMGAMMAGSMQAPMAGLIAILELTGQPNIILPGMLAVVAATIASGRMERRESVFHGLLRARGLAYRNDPVTQSLRRIGVASVMDRRVAVSPSRITSAEADRILREQPAWIVVRGEEPPESLLAAVDLVRARKELPEEETYNLQEVPGEHLHTAFIDVGATLQQALDHMQTTGLDVLCVGRQTATGMPRVYGVLTRKDIDNSYRY